MRTDLRIEWSAQEHAANREQVVIEFKLLHGVLEQSVRRDSKHSKVNHSHPS